MTPRRVFMIRNRHALFFCMILLIGTISACGKGSDSYGDACPILRINSTSMALVVASIPVDADMDTRVKNLQNALHTVGASSLDELQRKWVADINTVLGFSGSLKPPTGSKYKLLEDLQSNVVDWDWNFVRDSNEVTQIMSGFADIDEACSK